jgi:hypothetical protein
VGVDLGHGLNQTLPVQVTIDDGTPIQVTATLEGIVNSRNCDVVCFDHRATVVN